MKQHIVLATLLATATIPAAVFAQKAPIPAADQLPRRTYQVKGSALEILADRQPMDRLASELSTNLRADLERYEIKDQATLIGHYSTLLALDLRTDG